MKKPITADHISFKCPMNWDEMAPSDNGRFCHKCSKEVFDLSGCSIDEVRELQRKHGKICGMVKATVVAASLSMVACEDSEEVGEIRWVGEIEAPDGHPTDHEDAGEDQQPTPETEPKENP